MPSGNTHDAITFLSALPAAAIAFAATNSLAATAVFTAAFVFGGLMFGPDLDTVSKQYSRWRFFRFVWFPYRSFFKHRSRWSHGLIFGTLFRVVYFMGVVTLLLFIASYFSAFLVGTPAPRIGDLSATWGGVGRLVRVHGGGDAMLITFLGLWAGAASHTFADMAGTYIKTGRTQGFL